MDESVDRRRKRADDGLRTRDLQLGKLALYQLSYVRVSKYSSTGREADGHRTKGEPA